MAWSSIRIVPKVGHGLHDPGEFVTQERGRWDGVLMKRGLSPPERLVVAWIDGGRGADQSFLCRCGVGLCHSNHPSQLPTTPAPLSPSSPVRRLLEPSCLTILRVDPRFWESRRLAAECGREVVFPTYAAEPLFSRIRNYIRASSSCLSIIQHAAIHHNYCLRIPNNNYSRLSAPVHQSLSIWFPVGLQWSSGVDTKANCCRCKTPATSLASGGSCRSQASPLAFYDLSL